MISYIDLSSLKDIKRLEFLDIENLNLTDKHENVDISKNLPKLYTLIVKKRYEINLKELKFYD